MNGIAPVAMLTLALASSACAPLLSALGTAAGITAPNSSGAPPLPPPPDNAVLADSLNARKPEVVAFLAAEISTGGSTKQCIYSYAGSPFIRTVSAGDLCPPMIKVRPR